MPFEVQHPWQRHIQSHHFAEQNPTGPHRTLLFNNAASSVFSSSCQWENYYQNGPCDVPEWSMRSIQGGNFPPCSGNIFFSRTWSKHFPQKCPEVLKRQSEIRSPHTVPAAFARLRFCEETKAVRIPPALRGILNLARHCRSNGD